MPTTDREVFITAATLVQLLREYVGPEILPPDARTIAVNTNHNGIPGMLGLKIASTSYSGLEPDEIVEFGLLRNF